MHSFQADHKPMAMLCGCAAVLLAVTPKSHATWSIVMVDCESKDVAVGTVTCLNNFDLLALVPVVVVGKGAAAVQAAGDFDGIRRPIIFEELMNGTAPADILDILENIGGHSSRQYGIVDVNGEAITFTGNDANAWAGGVTGTIGSITYAIQGNILAGDCVVPAIEQAVLNTPGGMADKLMAGMIAAHEQGGDGRCSCSPANPTSCGCPPPDFDKSGHIGCMVMARLGDIDDVVCNASGCADGSYFMRLNVPFQDDNDLDPTEQLEQMFNEWGDALVGRPDAQNSTVDFEPNIIPPNGVATTTMRITLLDINGDPATRRVQSLSIAHTDNSAGLSAIGAIIDEGGGVYTSELTAGNAPGVDEFRVKVIGDLFAVFLWPPPTIEYFQLGDIDGDGTVGAVDLITLLGAWGRCDPRSPCINDLDGDGAVGTPDLIILLGNWG